MSQRLVFGSGPRRALRWFVLFLGVLGLAQGGEPVLPKGIIPVPAEPGIVVTLKADKATYAPGDKLQLAFTLSRDAHVYLYNLTADGKIELLVPNRFLQDPRFAAGNHALPTKGWVLRVTEPEGIEYLQLVATEGPLSFYEAKAFEKEAFLLFADPAAFAARIQGVLAGSWGTAWARFRVHQPTAALTVNTSPAGASVWADGSYLGTSPVVAVVAPGKLKVRVEKEGYETRSLDLTLGDGEEVTLAVTLSRARPSLWPPTVPTPRAPAGPPPPIGFGLAVGLDSLAGDLWVGGLGFGLSLRMPPPRPDLTLPGPGGLVPWGPEVEFYLGGWVQGKAVGLLLLAGFSCQEMAWIPAWTPLGAVVPMVDVEPETETKFRFTWGVGLGASGSGWRAYLAWHSRRGPILGFTVTP
ncbi:MAG: DUF4384 domain-containing protein, partial [Candidatus Bipolaricaulota bacterium]